MELVMRRGGQPAFDFHAMSTSEHVGSLPFSEAEVSNLTERMNELFTAESPTTLKGGEVRQVLEFLKGKLLVLKYVQGCRHVRIPFMYDNYDEKVLFHRGVKVVGLSAHRLERVTIGGQRVFGLTYRKRAQTEDEVSHVTFAQADEFGGMATYEASKQESVVAYYRAIQRKINKFEVPVTGNEVPKLEDILVPLTGRVVQVEWQAIALDPVWRVESKWLPIEQVEVTDTTMRISGPGGWCAAMSEIQHWRSNGSGIVLTARREGATIEESLSLTLIRH